MMPPQPPMQSMQPMQWFPGMPTVSGSVSLEPYGQNQHPFFPQQYAYPPQYPYGMPSTPVHQPPSCVTLTPAAHPPKNMDNIVHAPQPPSYVTSTPAANPPKNMDNIIHEMDMSGILQLPVNQDNCQENQENQPMETAADTNPGYWFCQSQEAAPSYHQCRRSGKCFVMLSHKNSHKFLRLHKFRPDNFLLKFIVRV